MTDDASEMTVRQQLERAARDLWASVKEIGDDRIVFMDRRRLWAHVEHRDDGRYYVSWEEDDGSLTVHQLAFDSPREAAFHGYQGPH